MKFTYNSLFHSTLFKYVPQCENIIHTSTPLAKSRLLVQQEVTNSLGDALKNDLAKDFTRHRQKGNSSPVVTITLRDPFFGTLIIPLLQSVGIFSCSQIFLNKGVWIVTTSSGFALNSSAFRLSWPRAFPFFRELMAWMISLLVGTSVLMSRSVAVSRMFGTTVGMVMTEQSYKTFLSPLSKQRTPLQACITWMTWAQPMFCASCGKSCRDNLAVNGRKELTGLGVTRDRQPTSTTYASLCPKKPTWWQTQSTWRKASADQRIQLTSTASRTKTRVGEERKNSANLATKKRKRLFGVRKQKTV